MGFGFFDLAQISKSNQIQHHKADTFKDFNPFHLKFNIIFMDFKLSKNVVFI